MTLSRIFLSCVVLFLINSICSAESTSEQVASPTGRTVFFLDEEISIHLPAKGDGSKIPVTLTSVEGVERKAELVALGGYAVMQIAPNMLAEGQWTLATADGRGFSFRIARPFQNTPFAIVNYGGTIPDDDVNMFGGPGPMKVEERIELYRDTFGMNLIMHVGNMGGPIGPKDADRAASIPARIVAQHVIAGQHQPGGQASSWADPALQLGTRYRGMHVAQQWRRIGGKTFVGVHYADEPGLTWGQQNEKGEMARAFPGEQNWYVGPYAVPAQHALYEKTFGKKPANWQFPEKDLEGWLHFMRWRTTILGDLFAQITKDIHATHPDVMGFSQLYAWRTTAEGLYPPENAKGIDVLATHGYAMWTPLGHLNPAHEVDAMRSGAWDKPLWMIGPWMGSQADEGGVRAVLYGVLARKVEGIIWPLDWKRTWPEAAEVSQKILPLSGMLHDTAKPRDTVGLLHSRDQHLVVNSRHLRAANPGTEYHGLLLSAWSMAMAAGYPASRVVEGDLISGKASEHKMIFTPALTYVSDATRKALEKYIADGGVLFLDSASTVDIKGARKLPFAFKDSMNEEVFPRITPIVPGNSRKFFEELIAPDLPALKKAFEEVAPPLIECSNPEFAFGEYLAGKGRYIWIVNNANQRKDDAQFIPVDAEADIRLPNSDGVIYDVFARKLLPNREFKLKLAKGDAALYAFMPAKISGVNVDRVEWKEPGLTVALSVNAGETPVDAIIPVSITLKNPKGQKIWTVYRATKAGKFEEVFDLGYGIMPGEYTVEVSENLSDQKAQKKVAIKASEQFAWQSPIVETPDEARIRSFLSKPREILVAYGSEESKKSATQLADDLNKKGFKAKAVNAADYNQEVEFPLQGAPFPIFNGIFTHPVAIHQDVIVIGSRKDNQLMERLIGKYGLSPWPLSFPENAPGQGRALMWWSRGAFGLNHESVAILANDPEGLKAGVDSLLKKLP